MDDLRTLLAGSDAPRPLSDSLRARLEGTLLGAAATPAIELRGIDAARPLPPHLRRKLRRLISRRGVVAWRTGIAVAAVAALVLGIVALPNSIREDRDRPVAGGPSAQPSTQPQPRIEIPGGSPTPAHGVAATPGAVAGGSGVGSYEGSPPPFDPTVRRGARIMPAPQGGSGPSSGHMQPPPPPPPVAARIAVTGADDPDVSAGFDAYVDLVREQGEVGNRTFEIVRTSAAEPAHGALVTVNLGSASLAGAEWIDGPLLDSLDTRAPNGDVFDIASTPVRQARVLARRLLTDKGLGAGSVAVIYRVASGEFAQAVPDAIAAILRDAEVVVLMVDYRPGNTTLVRADVAVLSMPPAEAAAFADQATKDGYAPAHGLAGIWSLYDDAVRAELGPKVTLVSPYWATGSEHDAIAKGVADRGGRMGAEAIHGWATAKAIALALYWSDPRTPTQMKQALSEPMQLGVCPYALRAGSHERKPDGVVVEGTREGFTSKGEFSTDETP